jgi:hypothetical protein
VRTLRSAAAALLVLAAAGCATAVYEEPTSGPGATYETTFATAIEKVVARADLRAARGKKVFVLGFAGRPGEGRPSVDRFVANRAALRVVEDGGAVTTSAREAALWLIPVVRVAGGATTHREYRMYGYPVYVHDSDWRVVSLALLLYDRASGVLEDAATRGSWHLRVDSFILDIFGWNHLY